MRPLARLLCFGVIFGVAACGDTGRVPLRGSVTVGGAKADAGDVRFVPLDDDGAGPAKATTHVAIIDGEYLVANRGGLPPGAYRVEVDARKKNGKRIMKGSGTEMIEADETVRISPDIYAGEASPLKLTANRRMPGRYDIDLPSP